MNNIAFQMMASPSLEPAQGRSEKEGTADYFHYAEGPWPSSPYDLPP